MSESKKATIILELLQNQTFWRLLDGIKEPVKN